MTEVHVDTADLDSIRSVSDDWHATNGVIASSDDGREGGGG